MHINSEVYSTFDAYVFLFRKEFVLSGKGIDLQPKLNENRFGSKTNDKIGENSKS